jgi:hypothetical protein
MKAPSGHSARPLIPAAAAARRAAPVVGQSLLVLDHPTPQCGNRLGLEPLRLGDHQRRVVADCDVDR